MLKCKEPPQESFHIWAIHQRRTFCQKMVYRFVIVFVIVQSGTLFWENGMNQRKLERRPVVIVAACMKARKYKRSSGGLERWRDQKNIQLQRVTT